MNFILSKFKGDRTIWTIYILLCLISLVEVFSAGSSLSYGGSKSFYDPLIRQAAFLGFGTLLVLLIHRIPCRFFRIIPIIMLPVVIVMLTFTLFTGSTNGASRWIELGSFSFQPSELAKGTLVITTALILSRMQNEKSADPKAFKHIMFFTCIICGLIITENLSTAVLLFGTIVLMMFIGRVPMRQLGKLFGVLALSGLLIGGTIFAMPEDSKLDEISVFHRMGTWKNRIKEHIADNEVISPKDYDIDKGAQKAHANIAIASCNFVGKMPGNSVQRDFLSQAYSDFIFAIIIEEMGLWGATIVICLYIFFFYRTGRIASKCKATFPRLLVMGLTIMLVLQAFFNMLVAVDFFPITGQPLPLISRGGTSTLITCIYIGMILSVSHTAPRITEDSDKPADGTPEGGAQPVVEAETAAQDDAPVAALPQ